MRALLLTVLVIGATASLAPAALAADFTVSAENFFWSPASLSVSPGQSVEFVLGSGSHTWVRDDGTDSCSLPCTRTFSTEGSIPYHCGIHPSMTGNILVGTLPTIAITTPAPGATVSGVARVEGTASHPTSSISGVTVQIGSQAAVTATLIGSGTSVSWTADVPTATHPNGAATLTARVTAANGLAGLTTRSVQVANAPSIDLRVSAASGQQNALFTNLLAFTIENRGNSHSGPFNVTAEYLYHETWRPIGTRTMINISPNSIGSGSITWAPDTPHVGRFTVRFTADPEGAIADPDRSNNVRTAQAAWVTNLVPGVVLTEP